MVVRSRGKYLQDIIQWFSGDQVKTVNCSGVNTEYLSLMSHIDNVAFTFTGWSTPKDHVYRMVKVEGRIG